MTTDELLKAIRQHALENYNRQGWDYLVECYEDEDILEEIGTAKTLRGAIRKLIPALRILDDHRREISTEW